MKEIPRRTIEQDDILCTVPASPGYSALSLDPPASVEDAQKYRHLLEDDITETPIVAWMVLRSAGTVPVFPLRSPFDDFEIPDAVRLPDGRVWSITHYYCGDIENTHADTVAWAKWERDRQVQTLRQAASKAAAGSA